MGNGHEASGMLRHGHANRSQACGVSGAWQPRNGDGMAWGWFIWEKLQMLGLSESAPASWRARALGSYPSATKWTTSSHLADVPASKQLMCTE